MLLTFVVIVFILLHIQFYIRFIFFGVDEVDFFSFTIKYLYSADVAMKSLLFSIACVFVFVIGYLASRVLIRKGKTEECKGYQFSLWPIFLAGAVQVVVSLYVSISSGFNYHIIAERLEVAGFVLELRIVFLLLLSHLLLNVGFVDFLKLRRFSSVRYMFFLYVISLLLLQARSRVFEVVMIFCFSHLMWRGDKIKLVYFAIVGLALIAPNIIVLGRLGWPDNIQDLLRGVFSFEYSVLFNNLLSEAIVTGVDERYGLTFIPSLWLLIPSPFRSALGVDVVKSDYYSVFSESAGVSNGGFSLLCELFTNFGWGSLLVLLFAGGLIGYLNTRALRVGRVSMMSSTAPLVYVGFILAFRNDLGVYVKYLMQLLIVAMFLSFATRLQILRVKKNKNGDGNVGF